MALTPQEEAELKRIRAERARRQEAREADEHLRTYRENAERPTEDREPNPFSARRVGVNVLTDTIEDTFNTLKDSLRWSMSPQGLINPLTASVGLAGLSTKALADAFDIDPSLHVTGSNLEIEDAEGSDNVGTAEAITRGIGSWLVPFLGASRALRGAQLIQTTGRSAKLAPFINPMIAGGAADFFQGDEVEANIANFLKDTFGLDNYVINQLVSEEDDTAMERRLKAAATGTLAGVAADSLLTLGGKALRALKVWRGSADEARATIENYRAKPITLETPPAGAADEAGDIPRVDADEVRHPSEAPADAWYIRSPEEPPVETWDDVLNYINDRVGDMEMSDDAFAKFAEKLMMGDPENVLARFGLKLDNLDRSVFRDPEQLARLQLGLSDALSKVAARMGRTGERVSMDDMVRSAEALGSTPSTLKELSENTRGLAERLTAGRIIVGAHAHVMMDAARLAMKEIEETGQRGDAWDAYLETFYAHGLVLGTVTGAKSEIGRALGSLRRALKVGKNAVQGLRKDLQKGLDEEAVEQSPNRVERMSMGEAVDSYRAMVTTNAEALEVLQNTIRLGGDVGELSRTVRTGDVGVGAKIRDVVAESVGNLFTITSAAKNTLAGLSFIAVDHLGKILAAVVRSPGYLMGGQHRQQAIRAAVEAWAYTQKAYALAPAFRNALAVTERELSSELALHADQLGFQELATKAQTRAGKAEGKMTGDFERADIVGRKALALPASTRKKLEDWVTNDLGDDPLGRLLGHGLKGLIRTIGATVNTVGTLNRAGTSFFIHVPDQFVGTLAQQAEGYARSARLAAEQGFEMGLEGKELMDFIRAATEDNYAGGPTQWGKLKESQEASLKVARHAQLEAKEKLFQTKPETYVGKTFAKLGHGFGSMLVPFVNTIVRIPERTLLDFTPLGLIKGRVRDAIARGGGARDEALARLSLSTMALFAAYQMSGVFTGKDGGYKKTARDAGRPSYSIQLGGDSWEFGSLEPIGAILGMGADIREYMEKMEDDPEGSQNSDLQNMVEASIWSLVPNILSKNWMQTVQKLSEALGSETEDEWQTRIKAFFNTFDSRVIAGSGIQRTLNNWGDGYIREAQTFSERLLRNSVAASKLPLKRDFLGRPIRRDQMSRFTGIPGDIMPTASTDPLMEEFGALNMRDLSPQRVQGGVRLTAEQYARFVELRGQEVRDKTGLTMTEKFEAIFKDPAYRRMTREQRIAAVRKAKRPYNKLAREALTREDESYKLSRLREEIFKLSADRGWNPQQREAVYEMAKGQVSR